MDHDIASLKTQLLQLDERRASAALTDEQYAQERLQIERNILDCVMRDPVTSVAEPVLAPDRVSQRPFWRLMAGLLLLLVLVIGGVYVAKRPAAPGLAAGSVTSVPHAVGTAAPPHASGADQMATMIDKLAARLKEKPGDAAGWAMLARSYGALGRAAEAVDAYAKALELSKDDAGLLADYADALAVKNNRSLSGEPMKLIQRALALDPRNVKALAMAGSDAFERKDYRAAVKFWDQVVALGGPGNLFAEQIQPSLAQARQSAGLPPAAPGASGPGPVQRQP